MSDAPGRDARGTFPQMIRRSLPIRVWSAVSLVVVATVWLSLLFPPRPLLIWNASSSSRIGLYRLQARAAPQVGDMVLAWPPTPARRLAAARHYLPSSVPLVKRVAAGAGDRVCAQQSRVYVDGREVARRRSRDASGRPLPWWSGCKSLVPGEMFLLSPDTPFAFDGRYFGVTHTPEMIGKLSLLWAKPGQGSPNG